MKETESKEKTLLPGLFEDLPAENGGGAVSRYRSYLLSPLIAAALPLKDVKKNLFERKYNNITLRITGGIKVPYGKYGRLLLSILTTHAVLEKNSADGKPVVLRYGNLQQLLNELQLPKQRGKDIKEQLECFSNASFIFEEKKTKVAQKSLFRDFYGEGESLDGDVTATKVSTGIVPFFEAFQYVDIDDGVEKKTVAFEIVLSEKFTRLSQVHSVPIDYTAYKGITSVVGKDLYAWFVYRNNSLTEPLFISRKSMVEQFMPVRENANEAQERVNWDYIKEQIRIIKTRYYNDLNISFSEDNSGLTLSKSNPIMLESDRRYVLVTANL